MTNREQANTIHVFAGDQYYPRSGLGDYQGTFPSVEDALKAIATYKCDWACLIQTQPDGSLKEIWHKPL